MNEYYFLSGKTTRETAFADSNEKRLASELIPDVIGRTELPFEFYLKKLTVGKHGIQINDDLTELKYLWVDYLPNSLAWPLMSERMKNIIDSHLTGKEGIDWVTARVNQGERTINYYLPKFSRKLDVVDEQKTIYVPNTSHIVVPIFSLPKIIHYTLFHKPQESFWEITSALYLNETLKRVMQKEKLIGVAFSKVQVSL